MEKEEKIPLGRQDLQDKWDFFACGEIQSNMLD